MKQKQGRTKLFAVFLFSIFMFQLLLLASQNISLSAQNNVSTNNQNPLQQHVDPTFASPEKTPPEMVGGFNVTADMVPFIKQGDVNPGHELHITKISYFAKYVVWNFLELNETHWRVKGFVNASLIEDVKAVLNGSMAILDFGDKWFPEVKLTDLPKLTEDCGKLGTYPLKALTSEVKFEVSSVNFLNGTFTFYMIFPNGFKAHQKAEWGLGTVTVSTDSIYPPNNAATLDTTPDFICTPVSDVSTAVNVTLFVNGVASGTIINAPNNTQVVITCNWTLPVSDAKIPWYFSVTDASGTVNTETRYISIGAYFKAPAVLINPNATVAGYSYWTYYLNASTTDLAVSYPIQIPDGNITLNGQGYTLDGDDVADYGIYVYRSAATTTNITITNITVQDWDTANIYFRNSKGNTVKFVTSLSSPDDGLCLYYSGNTLTNVIANSNYYGLYISSSGSTLTNVIANSNYYGLFLSYSDSNTLTNVTANSNYYGLYLSYSDSNIISNSKFQGSKTSGVHLYSAGNPANKFYNNLFNNTVNVQFAGTIYSNQWNTTKTAGTRIYSNGIEIGGNYWTNSTGNGPSDIGADADKDGFLDLYYDVQNNVLTSNPTASSNMDLLPYSDEYAANSPPTIGGFQAPATVYANIPFLLNITINDLDGVADFVNATVEISGSLPSKCKWENATNTFTEFSDPENYIVLHVDGSVKTQLNTTANKLTFNLTVKWEHPEGYVNITATVTDKFGANATLNVTNAFKFQHFSTTEQYNLNEQLKNEGKPHVTNSSQLITSLSYTPTRLELTVDVPPKATSITTVKGVGAIPQNVYIDGLTAQLFSTKAEFDTYNGKCWYYDSQNDIIYTKTTGSLIEILWQGYVPTPTPSPAPAPTPPTPTFDLKITRIPTVIYTLWQNQFTAEIQIANPTLLSTDVTLQWQLLDPQMQIIAYGQQIIYVPAQTNTTTTITVPTTFLAYGTYTLKTQITNPILTDPTIMTIQLTPIPLQQTIMVALVIAIVAVAYLTLKRKP